MLAISDGDVDLEWGTDQGRVGAVSTRWGVGVVADLSERARGACAYQGHQIDSRRGTT